MVKRQRVESWKMACLGFGIISLLGGGVCLGGQTDQLHKTYSTSSVTRIIFGTVDDVARNLVKVNKDKTDGISPRYLDLSKVEKKGTLEKGDRVKMQVNNFNIVTDYWIVQDN